MIDATEHSVLIAHDDVHMRCELAFALRAAGFQTVQAGTGAKALMFATEVSAALIHIRLPDLDAREVCRILRSRPETGQLPIIQVAARAEDDEALNDAAASIADAFIWTPVEQSVLTDTVVELLANKT